MRETIFQKLFYFPVHDKTVSFQAHKPSPEKIESQTQTRSK